MNNIKAIREMRGKKQQECADALGITLRAWQGYEQGVREPKFETLIKIADMFQTTTDYLLGRDTSEKPAIELLAAQFDMSALEQEIIKGYLDLPESMRDDLMDFLERAVRKVQAGAIPTPMIARSSDDRPPGIMMLTPEQKKRLDEAPDETKNPDNDI